MKSKLDHVASLIRQMRAYRKLSQDEVAKKTGMSRSTLSLIEKGAINVKLSTIETLTDALDCKFNIEIKPYEESEITTK